MFHKILVWLGLKKVEAEKKLNEVKAEVKEFADKVEAKVEAKVETAPAAGGEEAPPAAEVTPESRQKDMNILVENNFIKGSQMINLGQGQDYLGEISKHLDKLLNS
jgi:predicted phage tail protein